MQKNLYFICPTDCIEPIINKAFNQENYFYTSLGNSFHHDNDILKTIKSVVQKHQIQNIYFILSSDNKIINDALNEQCFSDIDGLAQFYTYISKQQQQSAIISKNKNLQFVMLSYFLNKKIEELQYKLSSTTNIAVNINAKIYDKKNGSFTPIYSNLVCLEKFQLN